MRSAVVKILVPLALLVAVVANASPPAIAFAPGMRLSCPDPQTPACHNQSDRTEPAIRVDYTTGQAWVTDQKGIVIGGRMGVQLWNRAPNGSSFTYHSKVDDVPELTNRRGFALGGGDSDLTIGTTGNVYATSLNGASVVLAAYRPDGTLIHRSYVSGNKLDIDRQWIASVGEQTLYLFVADLATGGRIYIIRSDDGGLTWGPPIPAAGGTTAVFGVPSHGNIIVDPDDGAVYAVHSDSSTLWLARCRPGGVAVCRDDTTVHGVRANYEAVPIYRTTGEPGTPPGVFSTLFPIIAQDRAGNLFVAWSDRHEIWLSSSTDGGDTWSTPTKVADTSISRSSVFPWIVAGSEGRVGIAWLGSLRDEPEDETGPAWYAYYAQSIDALSPTPTFTQVQASDDPAHNAPVCLQGLNCTLVSGGNRSLAEVVTLAIDVDGYSLVAYPDDWEGNRTRPTISVIAKQISGDTLFAPGDFPS